MERTNPAILKPFSQSDIEKRRRSLADLLNSERTGNHLSFVILAKNERVISIGVKGQYYGMWLFDANSREEVENLNREGLTLEENETDMILTGRNATIEETNKLLPRFLMKFYPELPRILGRKRLKVQPLKSRKAA